MTGQSDIIRRPVTDADEAFIDQLLTMNSAEQLGTLEYENTPLHQLVTLQAEIKRQSYELEHPNAIFEIIEFRGEPVGLHIAEYQKVHILLIDIFLLPETRGLGIGTTVIQTLKTEAEREGKSLRMHVFKDNIAFNLYRSLGFEIVRDTGAQWEMIWRPARSPNPDDKR